MLSKIHTNIEAGDVQKRVNPVDREESQLQRLDSFYTCRPQVYLQRPAVAVFDEPLRSVADTAEVGRLHQGWLLRIPPRQSKTISRKLFEHLATLYRFPLPEIFDCLRGEARGEVGRLLGSVPDVGVLAFARDRRLEQFPGLEIRRTLLVLTNVLAVNICKFLVTVTFCLLKLNLTVTFVSFVKLLKFCLAWYHLVKL